ncbi:GGDEF domain-containing phosphodiesterase [Bradyrhizobium sp. ARR65]|uniref:GGDEF domain-containing phosphodiesterase n=1 Tax=Bradyrhizobium sp. ARR65 TaxID=1040989 RepID=UPI000467C8EE|nr:GGDEF domain-containing phosphodiesterase [Bradyrhizobium sp. ARR65]
MAASIPSDEFDGPATPPERLRFLGDVDACIKGEPHEAGEPAVLVIDAATPDQYADLSRALGELAAASFEKAWAERIRAFLPARTSLYHLSAARFACILPGGESRITEMLDELGGKVWRPAKSRAVPAATSIAIGVACYPRDGGNADALLRAAAEAAHESLHSARPWCRYSAATANAWRRSASLLRDIGAALAGEDQLHLVYQPMTDLKSGRCVGAEALLRWNHPILGPVPPSEFVPLVEGTALVHAMTDWVLSAALRQVADWRAAGLHLKLAVNVSMSDLADEGFPARLAALLGRYEVRPDRIDIEVTESAAARDPGRAGRQLDAIRRLGIAIVIDDFGTGQAALSYLKHIPATLVKIDEIFFARLAVDRGDQIMVRSTIDLVHALGYRVVAEGIADAAALQWLREHDCDIGQGYAISPPLDARDLERWLRSPPGPGRLELA